MFQSITLMLAVWLVDMTSWSNVLQMSGLQPRFRCQISMGSSGQISMSSKGDRSSNLLHMIVVNFCYHLRRYMDNAQSAPSAALADLPQFATHLPRTLAWYWFQLEIIVSKGNHPKMALFRWPTSTCGQCGQARRPRRQRLDAPDPGAAKYAVQIGQEFEVWRDSHWSQLPEITRHGWPAVCEFCWTNSSHLTWQVNSGRPSKPLG